MRLASRRTFLAYSAAFLAAPLAAEAQQAGKVYRIGVLFEGTPPANMDGSEPRSPILRAFLQGLRDLGYVEGQNLVVERRSAAQPRGRVATTQRRHDPRIG